MEDIPTSSCATVVHALARRGREDSKLARDACLEIASLATASRANANELREAKAFDAVIQALRRWSLHDLDAARAACMALEHIPDVDYAECKVVARTMHKWCRKDKGIAKSGCAIIAHGTEQPGACEAVMASLRAHFADCEVAESACYAIETLAERSQSHAVSLAQSLDRVIWVLQNHKGVGVMEAACLAFCSIANHADMKLDGGGRAIMRAMAKHGAENATICQAGCAAMQYLFRMGELDQASACKTLTKALHAHCATNMDASVATCKMIVLLAADNKRRLVSALPDVKRAGEAWGIEAAKQAIELLK